MKKTLRDIMFALTLIPYGKLIDENATSILKNLKKSQ